MLLSVGWFPLILAAVSGPWSTPAFLPVTPSPMPTYHATHAKPGVLLAHSLVPVRLNAPLSPHSSHMGQHFSFTVARDVSVGGVVVIPRCTRGEGIVSLAGRRGLTGGDLHLQFETLHPADGTIVALDPTETQARGRYRTMEISPDQTLFVAVADDTYPPAAAPTCLSPAPRIIAPVTVPTPKPTPKPAPGQLWKPPTFSEYYPLPTAAPTTVVKGTPMPTAAPTAVPAVVAMAASGDVLPANTKMSVRLAGDLNSLTAQTDQKFAFFLDQDVLFGGAVRVPKCTPGSGTVEFAERAGGGGHEGTLRLRFESLTLSDGTVMNLDPTEQVFIGQDQHGKAAHHRLGMYLLCGVLCIGGGGNQVSGLNADLPTDRDLFVESAINLPLPKTLGAAPVCPTPQPSASPSPAP